MIVLVFRHKYSLNVKTKNKKITENKDKVCKKWLRDFQEHAHKWYLYQQITGYWNLNRQVSDLEKLLNTPNIDMFNKDIPVKHWQDALDGFVHTLHDSATGRMIEAGARSFLNYLYRLLIREDANRKKFFDKDSKVCFDIEHIVPFSKFSSFDEDLPCSALGNLCYLPVKDNRSKRAATIHKYVEDRPSLTSNKSFLEMIDYPSKSELKFIDYSFDQFKTNYMEFIDAREKRLIEKFLALITK